MDAGDVEIRIGMRLSGHEDRELEAEFHGFQKEPAEGQGRKDEDGEKHSLRDPSVRNVNGLFLRLFRRFFLPEQERHEVIGKEEREIEAAEHEPGFHAERRGQVREFQNGERDPEAPGSAHEDPKVKELPCLRIDERAFQDAEHRKKEAAYNVPSSL